MSGRCEVWVFPEDQVVLISEVPEPLPPPYMSSKEAEYPFLGIFDDWRDAYEVACEKAEELGYGIRESVAWDEDDWDRGI